MTRIVSLMWQLVSRVFLLFLLLLDWPKGKIQMWKDTRNETERNETEWKEIIKEANEFGVEGGDWYESIGLDTMYELLEILDIDTDKDYIERDYLGAY